MANEFEIIQDLEPADKHFEVTVADGTALTKGTVMVWSSDSNTAIASSADGQLVAGVLLADKVANDGQTRMAVTRRAVCAGTTVASPAAIPIGQRCKIAGANLFDLADDDTIEKMSEAFCIALEAVGSTTQEKINVLVQC